MVARIAESGFGAHPEYPPANEVSIPARPNTDSNFWASASFAVSTELLMRVFTENCPPSIFTIARLFEVSTRPGISLLMRSTPSGQAMIARTKRTASASGTYLHSSPPQQHSPSAHSYGLKMNSESGSVPAYSALIAADTSANTFSASASLSAGTYTVAKASRGIALRSVPPSKSRSFTSALVIRARRIRAASLFAFPLQRMMSIPECPPLNPFTARE